MVLLHSRVAMLKSTQRQATKARRKNLQCSQHKKEMFKETERLPWFDRYPIYTQKCYTVPVTRYGCANQKQKWPDDSNHSEANITRLINWLHYPPEMIIILIKGSYINHNKIIYFSFSQGDANTSLYTSSRCPSCGAGQSLRHNNSWTRRTFFFQAITAQE